MEVLLADNQPQVRSALRLLLEHTAEIQIVGEVSNASDLLVKAQSTHPDLLLLDWELPGLTVTDTISSLRRSCPYLAIVALSGQLESRRKALEAGVEAFVSKSHPPEELILILHRVKYQGDEATQTRVENCMTDKVISTTPDTNLLTAYNLMLEGQVRRLPVLEDNRLVGIVSLNDIQKVMFSDNSPPPNLQETEGQFSALIVGQIMIPNPITILQNMTVGEAASLMLNGKVSSLPVINDDNNLVGIITESDIFRIIVKQWSNREKLKA